MCRALLPVALPRPETDDKSRALRNLWCFISCDLSVGTGTTITSTATSTSVVVVVVVQIDKIRFLFLIGYGKTHERLAARSQTRAWSAPACFFYDI